MKKSFLLIPFFHLGLCIVNSAFSQNPLVKMWDHRFGGTGDDGIASIQQTMDGGFILGGSSQSVISGDKTVPNWDPTGNTFDYWIVKTDSLGNKQWDKDFGGTDVDFLSSVRQTFDGGFILGGYSLSGMSGDKSKATWGGYDYWIVKLDSLGNKQWDKDFGGTADDFLLSIQQTSDSGFILGGISDSGISGDKTQAYWGGQDYWIIKTDSNGNKQWDKDFGGTGFDNLYSVEQTIESGFILGGYSNSGISGDKTQSTWGVFDYWIVKIDSIGNKKWDFDFGGIDDDFLYSIEQTIDGGYILGGQSSSTIGGDKTQQSWGNFDYWIVKIDSLGIKEWDKDFGGTSIEEFSQVLQTFDGGYLISGDSYSPISGDKTESNLGMEQTWVVKTDSLGSKEWDKTIFTSGHDEKGLAIQSLDGCYTIANSSDAGIAGYKTQASWNNSWDYFIVKFCDTTQLPIVALTAPNALCPGTCASFLNLSSYATSYQWAFPGAMPDTSTSTNPSNICYTTPGSYDVQLIASNANGSDTLLLTNYITVYPQPPAQSITQINDTLFAITGSLSYQWYFNGNIINGATDYFYVATTSGDYNVVATDSNGCEVEAVINNVIASNTPVIDCGPFIVFPNPVQDRFTILNAQCIPDSYRNGTAIDISVYNILGEKLSPAVVPLSFGEGWGEANCQLLPPVSTILK